MRRRRGGGACCARREEVEACLRLFRLETPVLAGTDAAWIGRSKLEPMRPGQLFAGCEKVDDRVT